MVEVSQKIYPAGQKREIRYTKRALLFMLTFAVKINAETERERETSPRLWLQRWANNQCILSSTFLRNTRITWTWKTIKARLNQVSKKNPNQPNSLFLLMNQQLCTTQFNSKKSAAISINILMHYQVQINTRKSKDIRRPWSFRCGWINLLRLTRAFDSFILQIYLHNKFH